MSGPLVGLLLCDHLPVAGPHHDDYDRLYESLLGPFGVRVRSWWVIDGEVPSVGDADAWLVGGSRHAVIDDLPWIAEVEGIVRDSVDSGRPVVGVCFGHQLVAHALGGEVRTDIGLQAGAVAYDLADGSSSRLIAMHSDQVVGLPEGGEVLATAEACPIAAYSVGDRVLGVQPHPEFDAAISRSLVERVRPLQGDDWAEQRLATLDDDLESERERWGSAIADVLAGRRVAGSALA